METSFCLSPVDSLPSELWLMSMVDLTAKDIVQLSRVCRRLHDLVTENLSHIVRHIQDRKLQVLNHCVDHTIAFGKGIPLHHALARFIRHRGLWPERWHRGPDLHAFAALWLYNHEGWPPSDLLDNMGDRMLANDLETIAGVLLDLHVQFHVLDTDDFCFSETWINHGDFMQQLAWAGGAMARYGITIPYLADMWDAVELDSILEATLRSYAGESDRSHWPLTRLRYHQNADEQLHVPWDGLCTIEWISETFGVPTPPIFGRCGFAYCVETEWTFERVKSAIETGRGLEPLERMAILEQMYIH